MTRFTAIVKWNDEWFSNLKPIEKLVFLYLTDRCDNAGFFEINKRVDAFLIGITEQEFIDNLKVVRKSYVASKDGKKVWLKNYIKYQKNLPLNIENNAHKQIINILKSNQDNFEYDFNILGANEGLISPIGKGNIIGKGIGKVKEGGLGETKNFNQKPIHTEDIYKELPKVQISSAIEMIRVTQQTDVTEKQIVSLWDVFKVQHLTGNKFYESLDKVYNYFSNWSKSQKFKHGHESVNGSDTGEKLGTSAARVKTARDW